MHFPNKSRYLVTEEVLKPMDHATPSSFVRLLRLRKFLIRLQSLLLDPKKFFFLQIKVLSEEKNSNGFEQKVAENRLQTSRYQE